MRKRPRSGKRKLRSVSNCNRSFLPSGDVLAVVRKERNEELESIMKHVVATSSSNQYQTGCITFLMWIYNSDSYRCLLTPSVLHPMGFAKEECDGGRITKTQLNTAHRGLLRIGLDSMVRSDPTTSPITLANLNFVVFSELY